MSNRDFQRLLYSGVRSSIIITVKLRRFYERFRPTLPTKDVRKRFVAKNVSGYTQDVKVELKKEVKNTNAFVHTKTWLCAPTFFT